MDGESYSRGVLRGWQGRERREAQEQGESSMSKSRGRGVRKSAGDGWGDDGGREIACVYEYPSWALLRIVAVYTS